MKTLLRTIHNKDKVEISVYDTNGRRCRHDVTTYKGPYKDVLECDNKAGYTAYARLKNFNIIDNYTYEHPKKLIRSDI